MVDSSSGIAEAGALPAVPPAAERRRRIAAAVAEAVTTSFVPFRGAYREVPLVRLPHELLLYRLDNGRLIAELEEHLAGPGGNGGRSWESLRAAQEGAAVQRLLHALLLARAADPRGPIFQELERQARQVEPLLVTVEGLVINGNRRLAAMRALRHRDPGGYAGFAEVSAAVLPAEAEAADIELVEAALQMAPETKLAYGWIDRRLKLRRQRAELGLPVERICEAYRLEDAAQLARELDELALADDYLRHYRGAPGHYGAIADAEPLFAGLQAQLAALPEGLRDRWRLAGFLLIEGRAAVEGPLERYFPFADPVPAQLPSEALRRFAEEQLTDAGAEADLDLLLGDRRDSGRKARALFELMETLRAEHHERRTPARLLKRIRSLRAMMDRLEPGSLSAKQRRQLRGEVAAIRAQAAFLLGEGLSRPTGRRGTGMLRAVRRVLGRG